MKTKDKVKYWLDRYPNLKDNDNRLCSNIWSSEMAELDYGDIVIPAFEFLRLYSNNKLTSAPSIKRARAKLQEEEGDIPDQETTTSKPSSRRSASRGHSQKH